MNPMLSGSHRLVGIRTRSAQVNTRDGMTDVYEPYERGNGLDI